MTGPDEKFLTTQVLTYLGNKRALLPQIGQAVETVRRSFFDACSGGGIVSR